MTSFEHSAGQLVVDLGAIRTNFRTIARHVAPAHCAAVVKANAYSLGVERVARALADEGCRHFFVATLGEALELRGILGAGFDILILNGVEPGAEPACADAELIPVLNSQIDLDHWQREAERRGRQLPAGLQIDSGMSRLGLPLDALPALTADGALRRLSPRLMITHLACSDEPDHPANRQQLDRFQEARRLFPGVPASIANSGGAFLPPDFHLDMVRTGIALFGVAPGPHAVPLQSAVSLSARILQIREIQPGDGVGYGLEHVACKPQRLATVGIGYADGWCRRLGGVGAAMHAGQRLPIVGRVSMDSMVIDISDLHHSALAEDSHVELLGPSQSVAEVAHDAGTIGYEILTRLGPRLSRTYVDAPECRR